MEPPGAIGAKIARPDANVLVATGDGGFLMNSQEIETALRERSRWSSLIWVDNAYGLISWKMDLEIGHDVDTDVRQPGLRRLRRELRRDRLPDRRSRGTAAHPADALADDTVSVIACPVDYTANVELIRSLGALDESMS